MKSIPEHAKRAVFKKRQAENAVASLKLEGFEVRYEDGRPVIVPVKRDRRAGNAR